MPNFTTQAQHQSRSSSGSAPMVTAGALPPSSPLSPYPGPPASQASTDANPSRHGPQGASPADLSTDSLASRLQGVARHQGFSPAAVRAMWDALVLGHGAMAQFSHDELGGSGQWMRGGMVMLGDMFNRGLASRVSALCDELSQLYVAHPGQFASAAEAHSPSRRDWWPEGLGAPGTSGSQNGMRYAYFPHAGRLAIERDGTVELHDTLDHRIGGVSQQQGAGRSLSFTSQHGPVDLATLPRVGGQQGRGGAGDVAIEPGVGSSSSSVDGPSPMHRSLNEPTHGAVPGIARAAAGMEPATRSVAIGSAGDPLTTLQRLAELHHDGVLTDAEFQAKKTELLARL